MNNTTTLVTCFMRLMTPFSAMLADSCVSYCRIRAMNINTEEIQQYILENNIMRKLYMFSYTSLATWSAIVGYICLYANDAAQKQEDHSILCDILFQPSFALFLHSVIMLNHSIFNDKVALYCRPIVFLETLPYFTCASAFALIMGFKNISVSSITLFAVNLFHLPELCGSRTFREIALG